MDLNLTTSIHIKKMSNFSDWVLYEKNQKKPGILPKKPVKTTHLDFYD